MVLTALSRPKLDTLPAFHRWHADCTEKIAYCMPIPRQQFLTWSNSGGISLLSVVGKLYGEVLIIRVGLELNV